MTTPIRLRTAAATTALALGTAACGLGASALATKAEAHQAMQSTMDSPKTVIVGFDAAYDLAELNQLAEVFGNDEQLSADDEEARDLDLAVAAMEAIEIVASDSGDRTGRVAITVDGDPVFDVRYDAADAPTGVTDPYAVEPYDLAIAARFDPAVAAELSALIDPDGVGSAEVDIAEALAAMRDILGADIGDAADAFADGEWVTVAGTFDPAMMTPADGTSPMGAVPQFDPNALSGAFADALSLSEPQTQGGDVATVGVDVDFGELVRGVLTVVSSTEGAEDVEAMAEFFGLDQLDINVRDAVTFTFEEDRLTEARVDFIDVGLQVAEQVSPDNSDLPAARDAVAGWQSTRLDLVATFTDHGDVPNQLDGIDAAVVLDWQVVSDALAETFASAGTSAMPTMPQADLAAAAAIRSTLRNLAVEAEAHLVENGSFPQVLTDLDTAELEYLGIEASGENDGFTGDGTYYTFVGDGSDLCIVGSSPEFTLSTTASQNWAPVDGGC